MNATCPNCGKPVPPSALPGLCPECMLKVGASPQTQAPGDEGSAETRSAPPPPTPAELAGHFPQLEILECLGRGGMGAVYKARQPLLNRMVALKILAPEREKDPQFSERFMREAQALARLNHPNIVTVYDFGETGGLFYLLMEYVDGMSLRQLLRSRRLAPEEALEVVPKICEALQFAHEQGVVHRDVKPENVLLDKSGRVKLADFGIAKIVGQSPDQAALTAAQQVIGTPYYMAPEQVEKPTKVDHRADIYSLGVVFYEMLTGELPLGKFALPSRKVQVDVRLDQVVLHALEKEPDRRYQRVSEVKTDVETIAAHTPGPPPALAAAGARTNIPGVLWVAIISLGLMVIGKVAVGVAAIGRAPNSSLAVTALLSAALSNVLLIALVRRARWAYACTLIFSALNIFATVRTEPITGAVVLLLDGLVCVPVLFSTNWFFRNREQTRPAWLWTTAALSGLAALTALCLPAGFSVSRTISGWFAPRAAATAGNPTLTQEAFDDVQPDGIIRFKTRFEELNAAPDALETYHFVNSDFVRVEKIRDGHGSELAFEARPGDGNVYSYDLVLPEPVPPGGRLSLSTEGFATGLIKATSRPDVFEYRMNHFPCYTGTTRRVEVHRLPPGAELISKSPKDFRQTVVDGRTELRIERLIPPGGSLEVVYRYRLRTGSVPGLNSPGNASTNQPVPAASAGDLAAVPPLRVVVDPRVELMSLIFRLAGNPEYNQGRVKSYLEDAEKQFGAFREHRVVQLARQLRGSRGVSYDACMSLAAHVNNATELQPVMALQPWPAGLDSRWTPDSVTNFLAAARQFVRDTSFADFLEQHRALYETTTTRMRALMDKKGHLEWFNQYLGRRPQADFTIALGLFNGGCCYGVRCQQARGKEELFCILGVWQTDGRGLPEFSESMLGTVVHEFGHSYVNPVLGPHDSELEAAGQKLFKAVAVQMRAQAYGNAQTMLRESLVRACEVRYHRQYEGEAAARKAIQYQKGRGFLWTAELSDLLADYEAHREQFPTLDAFAPRLVRFFQEYAAAQAPSSR